MLHVGGTLPFSPDEDNQNTTARPLMHTPKPQVKIEFTKQGNTEHSSQLQNHNPSWKQKVILKMFVVTCMAYAVHGYTKLH